MNLLFFDIDGTLITDDENRILPDSTREAIKIAREKGDKTFINTGRVFVNIEPFIRDIGFDGYVCGCGGYIRYEDKILYHKQYPQEVCRKLAYDSRRFGFSGVFEHAEKTCYDKEMDNPYRDQIVAYFSKNPAPLIDDIDSPDFVFDKFSAFIDETSDIEGFKKSIEPYFDYIDREGPFCEMKPKGHSKATGIQFLLDFFGLPLHNAYVFGDGNNDVDMLEYVPNSVCLGSGSDLAKKAAAYVTDDVLDDGIYNAMKHFGLI